MPRPRPPARLSPWFACRRRRPLVHCGRERTAAPGRRPRAEYSTTQKDRQAERISRPGRATVLSSVPGSIVRASAVEALLPGTGRCRPASSSEPPASVGLACRPVGAWRRQLVKRTQPTAADYGWASAKPTRSTSRHNALLTTRPRADLLAIDGAGVNLRGHHRDPLAPPRLLGARSALECAHLVKMTTLGNEAGEVNGAGPRSAMSRGRPHRKHATIARMVPV
jgi:hypothetical protein